MELWCPFAVRWQGNSNVTGYPASIGGARAPKRGAVLHSAEGDNWGVIHDLLLTKSWHFTIGYDRIEQHHPIDINCWHAGDTDDDGAVRANIDLDGIEALGVAGHPLTDWQVDAEVRLNRWLAGQYGRSRFRRFDGWDPDEPGLWLLAEHNQVSNTYTACPSGRIRWAEIIQRLEEAMPPTEPTDAQRLTALSWLADAAEAIAQRRPLTQAQKDRLRFVAS